MLIAEEMSLRDLRNALQRTQAHVAKDLGINQESVSRIEKRTDLLLSTLNHYVETMGGKLRLVVEFPDRPPVVVTGLGALAAKPVPEARNSSPAARRSSYPKAM